MSDLVTLAGVQLTRVTQVNRKGTYEYDGAVTLRVDTSRIGFDYVFEFEAIDSVPDAILRAIAALKHELEVIAAAAPKATRSPPPVTDLNSLDDGYKDQSDP